MGNSQSFDSPYAVQVEPSANPNQTGTYRAATHPDELTDCFADMTIDNCWDLFQLGRQCNQSGKCLGRRIKKSDGSLGEFTWLSFNEVDAMARSIGSALLDLGAVPILEFPEEKYEGAHRMRELGIFSKNRVEWFLCEQAANAYGITLVPLYDTLGDEALRHVFKETKMTAVACGNEAIDILLRVAGNSSNLSHVICFDPVDSSTLEKAKSYRIQIHQLEDLLNRKVTYDPTPGNRSTVATLCYTSGTTGNPKGVILSQGNFVSCVTSCLRGPLAGSLHISHEDVHISYLPLAHVFERVICSVITVKGAAIGIYSGDTLKLLDDVRELEPTVFISVPRLFNRINDKVFGSLKEKSAVAQHLFGSGIKAKLAKLRSDATVTHPFWDRLVFNKIKQLMGGKLRYMLVGGAPIEAIIEERMKILFCAPLCEGYGLSETLGGSFISNPMDPVSGHVGGPIPCLEFRLESVPEMEYEITSNPPRGELLLRGHSLFKGYFGNTIETEQSMDEDGWFHTGDIVVLLPTGAVKVIDRKKNIFKLGQGEYVAPEKIESVYQQASLVAQVFAFGYSSKFVLVGIVVPDSETTAKWAAKNKRNGMDLESLCKEQDFKKAVLSDMESVAKESNLKGFEKLKDITLVPFQFTTENGLLTPTFKLRRHFAKQFFQKDIDAMYSKLVL